MRRTLRAFGLGILAMFSFVGECTFILLDAVRFGLRSRFELAETINQMAFVGVSSLPIVIVTCFFSGAVLSLYSTQFLVMFNAGSFAGATAGLAVTRELAPVLAGAMVTARCGSAMAAQIGTMAVTEQLDALRMLSVHPTSYLVVPA